MRLPAQATLLYYPMKETNRRMQSLRSFPRRNYAIGVWRIARDFWHFVRK